MALLSTDRLDRKLDLNGDATINQSVSGPEGVIQRIRIRIQIFLEEWSLNKEVGIPYFQKLLGHKFKRLTAVNAFRKEISKVQGVNQVLTLDVQFDGRTRSLTVTFNVRSVFGDIASSLVLGD
jgi:hypothetical protein